MTTALDQKRLRDALGARPFQFYEQCGSTNDLARDWALAGAASGSVVLTEEQISGRGRFARGWVAPPGTALLFSVILRPRLAPERLPRLTMVGAIAVIECLDELAANRAMIKWPNDVQIAGQKVAGILPEALWQNDQFIAVILGIGLNVRIDFGGTELDQKATSIETALGISIDRAMLLNRLLMRIDYWSVRANESSLFEMWRARLNTVGQRVTAATKDGRVISGRASAVDEDGALVLEADDGTQQRVIAGEVTLAMGDGG